jgi:uncharacterized protein involved in response to NO
MIPPHDQKIRNPMLFTMGFRPFFLLAGLWAVVGMGAWLALLWWGILPPTAFAPVAWHAHEMLFGYVTAAVAGFLLTAVPNWTGRAPLAGWPLGGLVLLWCAGRVAMATSAIIGAPAAAAVDCAFLAGLLIMALTVIVGSRNWRDLPIMAAIALLLAANGMTHAGVMGIDRLGDAGLRLAIAVIVMLISLIGGRIVPNFTDNWLKQMGKLHLSPPFGGMDKAALIVAVLALGAWVVTPESRGVGVALIIAGCLQGIRLARWHGIKTGAEPLVWVLHLGYGWVAAGLVLTGCSIILSALGPGPALHALTIGAMGTMTLGVMTRATLGHTGRALHADRMTMVAYGLVSLAALVRISAGLAPAMAIELQTVAGIAWISGFGIFVLRYGPMHLRDA